VQILLDRGAGIDAEDRRYGSALQLASFRGHDKIVQMLQARLELLHRSSKVGIVINNGEEGARDLLFRI
jgi:ankyrin repeat protein